MLTQWFTKWYVKYLLLALCVVELILLPLMRGPWIGTEPFLFARLAESIQFFDALSYGGRFAAYAWGTPLVLHLAPQVLLVAFPILFGVLSYLVFSKILEHFALSEKIKNVTLLLLLLSPTFIYTFSFSNSLYLAHFLFLASFYFFLQEKKYSWLSLAILLILPLFSVVLTTALLFFLLLYTQFCEKDKWQLLLRHFFVGLGSSILYYSVLISKTGFPEHLVLETSHSLSFFSRIIFDLGASFGIGTFLFILAVFGISRIWQKKYNSLFFFLSFTGIFLFSFFRSDLLPILNLFLVFFAAIALISLAEARWTSLHFQRFALLLLVFGIIFSTVSVYESLSSSQPDDSIVAGLAFLSEQEEGVVFSHYSRGVWINSAGQPNVMDENYLFAPDVSERLLDSEEVYYSRDLDNSTAVFEKYNVSYVWIDEEMSETIWDYETQGLLFILQYTKDFKQIYNEDGVEIWEVGYD